MSRFLADHVLEDHLSTIEVLRSVFPLPGELVLPAETTATVDIVRAHLDASPSSPAGEREVAQRGLAFEIHVMLEPPPGSVPAEGDDGWALAVQVVLPVAQTGRRGEGGADVELDLAAIPPIPPTTITLQRPGWLSDEAFQQLNASIPESAIDVESDTTSRLLDPTEHLKIEGPKLISLAPASSSIEPNPSPLAPPRPPVVESGMLPITKDTVLCLSKMHHIVNQPKLRRLKALAITHSASGYVKSGRPGVMLYELESKEKLHEFLKGVRGLNYLEFHHLQSTPLVAAPTPSATDTPSTPHPPSKHNNRRKDNSAEQIERLNSGKVGLVELDEMKELVGIADRVGRKEWFRAGLGMSGGG